MVSTIVALYLIADRCLKIVERRTAIDIHSRIESKIIQDVRDINGTWT